MSGVGGVTGSAGVLALVAVVVGVVDVAAGEGARILDLESAEVLDVVPAEVDVGARAGVPPRGAEGLRRARVRDVEAVGVAGARPVQPLVWSLGEGRKGSCCTYAIFGKMFWSSNPSREPSAQPTGSPLQPEPPQVPSQK